MKSEAECWISHKVNHKNIHLSSFPVNQHFVQLQIGNDKYIMWDDASCQFRERGDQRLVRTFVVTYKEHCSSS